MRLLKITHLAIIGSGGYSMRKSLATLAHRGAIGFDADEGWNKILSDPRSIEQDWYGNPYRWWSDVMDIDPLPDFLKLNIPIIVGMGENDQSVPVESARFLDAKFKEAGKNNLTLKVYPEADHRLNGDGISHRDEFFRELSRLLQQTHNIAVNQDAPKAAQPFLH
ncbi:MAG: dienelactone hydrolase family protein [Methylobacter sp.]